VAQGADPGRQDRQPHPGVAAAAPTQLAQPAQPAQLVKPAEPAQPAQAGPRVGLVLRDGRHFALAAGDPGAEPFRILAAELLSGADLTWQE